MLPACWKKNRFEKGVVQIYTKNGWLKKFRPPLGGVAGPKTDFSQKLKKIQTFISRR
jgi:hypothetical protein